MADYPELVFNDNEEFNSDRLNKATSNLDLRIRAIEGLSVSYLEAIDQLNRYGLQRLNDAVQPVYDKLVTIGRIGVIFQVGSTSTNSITLGTKTFIIPEDRRLTFAPAAYLQILSTANSGKALYGNTQSYDETTGVLVVTVDQLRGLDEGPISSWMISAAGTPDLITSAADLGVYTQAQSDAKIATAINNLIGGAPAGRQTLADINAALSALTDGAVTIRNFAQASTAINNRLQFDAAQGLNTTAQRQALSNLGISDAIKNVIMSADTVTAFNGLAANGGTFGGPAYFKGIGTNGFVTGNGDAASYATQNVRLQIWNGLGISTYDGSIQGFYDARNGRWDTKAAPRVNGTDVWHPGNFDPGTKLNRAGDTMYGQMVFQGGQGGTIASRPGDGSVLQVKSTDGAAAMTFHRAGAYATWFGLDSDNEFRRGGWSDGGNSYKFWTEKNFDPNSKANANAYAAFTGIGWTGVNTYIYNDPGQHNFVVRTGAGGAVKYFAFNADGSTNFNGIGDLATAINNATNARGDRVYKGGDTMTGDLTISKSYPTLTLLWGGVYRTGIQVREDARTYLMELDTGAALMSVGPGGDISTRQFGDLNGRIEARCNAYANTRVDWGSFTGENMKNIILNSGWGTPSANANTLAGRDTSGRMWSADVNARVNGVVIPSWGGRVGGIRWDDGSYLEFLIDGGSILVRPDPSDERYKTNIRSRPDEDELSKIEKLRFVAFDWLESAQTLHKGSRDFGVIAQEVEKIDPAWVIAPQREDQRYALDTSAMLMSALRAHQQTSDRMKALEARLAALEAAR